MKRILIVGAVPDENHGVQFGGATVLMKNFLDYLSQEKVNYFFAQTNRFTNLRTGEKRNKLNRLYFMINFFMKIWFCRVVMFNFSDVGVVNSYPKLARFAKRLGKKIVLRKFGGSFDIYLKNVSLPKVEDTINAIKLADLVFIETQKGIEHIKTLVGGDVKVEWFPNNRRIDIVDLEGAYKGHKFVFMSHINDEKGVGDIVTVKKSLPEDFQIDLYGAIKEDKYRRFDFKSHGINYGGEISSDEVLNLLPRYSILLFPTSYREGYPGIIIEALGSGVPVITTDVGGIPEMIRDGMEGRIVKPGDVGALRDAMLSIDEADYERFSKNARKTFEEKFDSNSVNPRILKEISAI